VTRTVTSGFSPLILVLTCSMMICVAAITAPSPARADYTVTWCQSSTTDTPFTNGGVGAEPWNDIRYECGNKSPVVELDNISEQTLNGKDELKTEGVLKANHSYKVTVTAPTGITISHIATTLVSEPYNSGESDLEVQVGNAGGVFFSQEAAPPWSYNVNQALPSEDSTVTIGDRCVLVLNTSCYFPSPLGILTVASLSLTLHDVETPSLALTGGSLLLPGTQAGTEDVSFSASAQESGIAEVDAYLGSTLVGSDSYQSTQCSYTRFEPCPQTVSDNIAIDTTKVPDGNYLLVLDAHDASGNTVSTPWSSPVTVSNDASAAGGPLGIGPRSVGPGAPNGTGAMTKATISYLSGRRGGIKVRGGQSVSVSGRLTSQTGTPIANATVDLLSQTVGSIAPFVVIGHASTDATGVYTFTVPPGPSRVIRTGYRAFANDSGYDATAELTEDVSAATSLTLTPNHLRGRTFTFSGQVHASNFPPGQQVEIQALVGSTWTHVTFAQVEPNGHFKVHYRLKHHYNNVTFIFRATPVANPLWPYEPKQSSLARLHLL